MNYRKTYMKIIQKALQRKNVVDGEKHHILPRSLFPLWINRKNNIVKLTLREHYFCHTLLTKIYNNGVNHNKMVCALWFMTNSKKVLTSSRQYEQMRSTFIKSMSEFQTDNINNPFNKKGFEAVWFGKHHSNKTKQLLSKKAKERSVPLEWTTKAANVLRGRKYERRITYTRPTKGIKSEQARLNMRNAALGKHEGTNNGRARQVMCIETNQVFPTLRTAAQWAKCSNGNLVSCCKGQRKHAGVNPETRELTSWKYIKEINK